MDKTVKMDWSSSIAKIFQILGTICDYGIPDILAI